MWRRCFKSPVTALVDWWDLIKDKTWTELLPLAPESQPPEHPTFRSIQAIIAMEHLPCADVFVLILTFLFDFPFGGFQWRQEFHSSNKNHFSQIHWEFHCNKKTSSNKYSSTPPHLFQPTFCWELWRYLIYLCCSVFFHKYLNIRTYQIFKMASFSMHFSFRTRICFEDFRYSSAEHWRHVARSSCSRNRGRKEGQRGETSLRNSDEQQRNNLNSELVFFWTGGGEGFFGGGGVFWMIFFGTVQGECRWYGTFFEVFFGFPKGMRKPWGWNIDPNFRGTWFVECPYWCNYSSINVTINPRWFIYKQGGVVHL